MIKSTDHYVLVIDKERDAILSILFECSMDGRSIGYFRSKIEAMRLKEPLKNFITECSDKMHALDWCKDPNCLFEKKL